MIQKIEKIRNEVYICPGPSRLSNLCGGNHPTKGSQMSIRKCMTYPDCCCSVYLRQVDEMEEMEEN